MPEPTQENRRDPTALLEMLEGRIVRASEAGLKPRESGGRRGGEAGGEPGGGSGAAGPGSASLSSPKKKLPTLPEILPGAEWIENSAGRCVRIRREAPLTGERTAQGYTCPVDAFATPDPRPAWAMASRAEGWKTLDPESIAFVDIETTSLSGSTGTLAFLVGVGRFESDRFVVDQFFAEDFSDEAALVEAVDAVLKGFDALATYNGKTFDIPILETRWRMNRRRPSFPSLHLDLLHPARRLWSARLPDCRLGTIEREILGILRFSDVPSSQVPQIYFDYARGMRREAILPVIDHHAQDIFSLGAAAHAIAKAVTEPEDPRFAHASDQAGLARLFLVSGYVERAIESLQRAVLLARDEDADFRLSMLLARLLCRADRRDEAVELWQAQLSRVRPGRLHPLIELAKHAEHRLRDYAGAEQYTRRALKIIEDQHELEAILAGAERREGGRKGVTMREMDAIRHRLQRLQARARRQKERESRR